MWQHNYEPIGGSLALSALAAAIPIVVLFIMLGVPIGRMPGDITYRRGQTTFYFPIVTSIIASLLLTLLLALLRR